MADVQPILQVKDLYKRFGGLVAVDHVSLDIHPGEVVGLLGDNGAGKSTLIKMISGAYKPDGGQILLNGEAVSFSTPLEARRRGIETIYQDLALCDNLDASANIFLSCAVLSANSLAANAKPSPLPVLCTGTPV